MSFTRPLLIALALLGTVAELAPATALAGEMPIPAYGMVEIVPPPAIRVDGGPVDVAVVAFAPNGTGLAGLKLKPEASVGVAGSWREISTGLYQFTWAPPIGGTAASVQFSVKGKAEVGVVSSQVTMPLAPSGIQVSATANPASVTLGPNAESTLSIVSAGDPAVRVSSGDVKQLTPMGGGRFTAKFIAPSVPFPHLAIVAVADAGDPRGGYNWSVIPLDGAIPFPVAGPAGATVVLRIAGKEFGPVKLDANGQGSVPVVVPPGTNTGTQVLVVNGQSTESQLDLKVPESRRMTMFPLPLDVPVTVGSMPVRAVVLTPDGKPDTTAKVVFAANKGTMGPARHVNNGVYEASWSPAPTDTGNVKISASVDGSKIQADDVSIALLPARPARITLATDPIEIGPNTTSLKIVAHATTADGQPVIGEVVEIGGSVLMKGPVSDQKNGDYTATVGVPTAGVTRVTAFGHADVSRNPVRSVIFIGEDRVADDGASSVRLAVLATDLWGYPVANQTVLLELASGGGKLSTTTVSTDAAGIGRVEYIAGSTPGMARIRGSVGNASGWAGILQVPDHAARFAIPVTGGTAAETAKSWVAVSPAVVVPLQGGAAPAPVTAVAAAPALAPVGAAPARIDLTVPPTLSAGSTLVVTATARDANGSAIRGAGLTFLTSVGSFGPVTESDGVASATLTVPPGAGGTARISVMSDSGTSALGKIEISGVASAAAAPSNASPWATSAPTPAEPAPAPVAPVPAPAPVAPAPAPAPAPVAAEPKVPTQSPASAGDFPWFRARAGVVASSYDYEQKPSDEPGELLNTSLAVGPPDGGRAAGPVGYEVDARVWVPSVPYLGFHGSFRSTYYQIDAAPFSSPAKDWLNDLRLDVDGRYPFEVGANDQLWIGAKAGFRYNDFMLFKGCLEPSCQVEYSAVGLPGFAVGPEIGAEIGNGYVIGAYEGGFANFTTPYSNAIDLDVGYDLYDGLIGDLGFGWSTRTVLLQSADKGEDRGTLSDQQILVRLSLGWEM
jgi:hypothetical protein